MSVMVKVPGVGESVTEGMISLWNKPDGAFVNRDEVLCEIETDKASVEILAEAAGILQIKRQKGEIVRVGDQIAAIEAGEAPVQTEAPKTTPAKTEATATKPSETPNPGPAVRSLSQESGVPYAGLSGSGKDGRVTKGDMLAAIAGKPVTPIAEPTKAQSPAEATPAPKAGSPRQETREPMSMIRRRIAERLLASQTSAAILTTFNEVDMSEVMNMRNRLKDAFFEKHQVKLGFMGYFLTASVAALKEFPLVNASIDGTDIIYRNYCDIGVAVSTEKGLMVPVLRDVDKMSIADIEIEISRFAKKARDNKISLADLSGGTFTVSNGGVFGSLLSTPIINPPQTAILGMHKTQQRPVVLASGEIAARPMMYLALSYDHRLIDGKEAVGFLIRIKECLEDPSRMLLGV